jgi:hypothetical protein
VYVPKNREKYLAETQPNQRLADLLFESEKAVRAGNSQLAYEYALRATEIAPDSIESWLLRATLAPSLEERLVCVNRLNELMPDREDRHHVAFFTLKEFLEKKPFLAYLEETDELYRVRNADHMMLTIPKKRATVRAAVAEQSGSLKAAYRLFVLALFGLLLAGIGTLIFAPLSALAALQAGAFSPSPAERVSSLIVLTLSVFLFLLGAFFTVLFVVHLTG